MPFTLESADTASGVIFIDVPVACLNGASLNAPHIFFATTKSSLNLSNCPINGAAHFRDGVNAQ